jgi:2',3'-cyclic-nucleotide 2'-phosphodiesterase / 3'-nucleotidase
MRDLVSTYVYPNTLVVKKISGKDLKQMIEKCANYFEIENDEITVNQEYVYPKIQHFNYDMIDEIEYT